MSFQSRTLFLPMNQIRQVCSTSVLTSTLNVNTTFVNRNPRNLERMRIGYKPNGYHVEKQGKHNYWHKLVLNVSGRHVTASINHFENGEVLRASTSEWCIKKHLYRPKDTSAFINLGRILGFRCLQTGLNEISCNIIPAHKDGKVAQFLKALEDSGVTLTEPPQFKNPEPWDVDRPEKPWEVVE